MKLESLRLDLNFMKTCFTQEKFDLIDETKDNLDLMRDDVQMILAKMERMVEVDEIQKL